MAQGWRSAVVLDKDEFRRAFLPYPTHTSPPATDSWDVFKPLQGVDDFADHQISELFIQALNGEGDRLANGTTLSQFRHYKDSGSSTSKSDAAIFRSEQPSTRPSWCDQRIPVAFNSHFVGSDPFDKAEYDDEYGEIQAERVKVLNRITAVVELLFAAQHRVFLFFLLVIGRRFRLLRWDRAGVVSTPSIDYCDEPGVLCNFLWRLSHFDDAALGFDPSATRVLRGDVDFLQMDFAALKNANDVDHTERVLLENESTDTSTFEYARTMFRDSLAVDWPRYKVQVPRGHMQRAFLVCRPTFRANGVFGCGTRSYVALDCKTGRFVWLKDSWRAAHVLTGTEGDVLQSLNDAGIQNVPTLLCHGDIQDQTTITGEWWERAQTLSPLPSPSSVLSFTSSSHTLTASTSPSSKKRKRIEDDAEDATSYPQTAGPLRQHTHYRIVVAEVALPLKDFRNGKQLASVVLDAIKAHHQATTNPKTRLLHRDVSGGNILIYPRVKRNGDDVNAMTWCGILSDWELAKPVDDDNPPSKATQADQMGTYQFMSVDILSRPWKPMKVADELESFFHVLVYYSIRHLRSNCSHPSSYIDNYFNNYSGPGHLHTCGWKSLAIEVDDWLSTRFPHRPLLFRSPMDELLGELLKCFHAHYKVMKDDMAKNALFSEPPAPPLEPADETLAPVGRPDIVFFDSDGAVIDLARKKAGDDPTDDCDFAYDDFVDTPTAEDRRRAGQVADHAFVLEHVARIVRSPDWPEDDRIPVPEPNAWTATPTRSGGVDYSRPESNKRRRIAGPEPIVSLPARLHRSTRRTRMQPRTMPLRMR
ncbi:hypothetical protein GSI_05192 [Ganoderma sinense ZZ0214-1]|uniref:Fungal-type protein kinase domain-containing protein n=1 Tax=Ganoderma sinense ZZ0214-1 TaxID=1077348 RepID=A0A2G8SFE4_9APHY|nr:hypothetical protein GSI_05192 [Ganoderma sinense ZZ0214-1]